MFWGQDIHAGGIGKGDVSWIKGFFCRIRCSERRRERRKPPVQIPLFIVPFTMTWSCLCTQSDEGICSFALLLPLAVLDIGCFPESTGALFQGAVS